ncbi:MAG TPA: saccharopine dehydrogenase NADP-binding domain-containing protein [Jatrophihabitantaceae bacterium]|jgi:saccharopine dehydrogenase (NAD+, L-glutamate forming)
MAKRPYDIVLFGATGFTGGLTAEYLARTVPPQTSWALAGRNPAKLEAVRRRLGVLWSRLPLLSADADDPASLRELAESTRVLVTTVGPYVEHGEPLVAACAEAGTDYLDLTGEPEFVDRCYARYHQRSVETGARLVHSAGFDSVPHDLGAYFTVQQLPEGVPLRVKGFVRVHANFSGGTFQSAVTGMSRIRSNVAAHRERRRAEPRPAGRKARAVGGRLHRDADAQAWAVPLPTIDGQVVGRSARALDRYGPDFTYTHFAAVRRLRTVVGGIATIAGVAALAQLPPTRRWLLKRVPSGKGPAPARRARSWFTVRFVGEGGGRRVVTEVAGGDPGYDETAKILAESAMCLAFDELPPTSGQVTTATAMGDALIERLSKAGITFTVLDEPPTGPPSRRPPG